MYNFTDDFNKLLDSICESKVLFTVFNNVLLMALIITVLILILIYYNDELNIKFGFYIYILVLGLFSIHYYTLDKLLFNKYNNDSKQVEEILNTTNLSDEIIINN